MPISTMPPQSSIVDSSPVSTTAYSLPIVGEARLISCIRAHTGLTMLSHQLHGLREAAGEAWRRFRLRDANDFCDRLEGGLGAKAGLDFLITRITVGESYFFRIPEQIQFLRDTWLPNIIARRRQENNLTLRIWSAGCSAGEELYTIAILLHELLPDIARWRITLLGTDLNPEAVERAKAGQYRPWSLRATDDRRASQYFKLSQTHHVLAPEIRRMAQFCISNLAEDCYPSLANDTYAMDLILCRNVFIYFSADTVAGIMHRFANAIAPSGMVLLAPADIIEQRYGSLQIERLGDVHGFVHCAAHTISHMPSTPAEPITHVPPIQLPLERALRRAEEVVSAAIDNADAYLQRAMAEAALGRHALALADCERALTLNDLSPDAHYLRGQLMLNARNNAEALACFRRVIFLDWQRPECHFRLGTMAAARGDTSRAQKHMSDALSTALARPPNEAVAGVDALSYGHLVSVLRTEVSAGVGRSSASQVRS
jgi:chemotaxis protein methyltransferase CheR